MKYGALSATERNINQLSTPLKRVHFIGVSGSGMAGVALIAHKYGIKVSGSDLKESSYVQALLRECPRITFTHDVQNLADPSIEVVVVSTAIPDDNVELVEAKRRGIPIWSRAHMLAHLNERQLTLAVAGTHGKTTTSSMLATSLVRLETSPSFAIGGVVDEFNANAHAGVGRYFVIEADESDGSFVHFNPHLAIITNIEADHMDHFESIDEIRDSFSAFFTKVDDDGLIIACADSPGLVDLVRASGKPFLTYGEHESADVRFEVRGVWEFEVFYPDGTSQLFALGASPGIHNMSNATAVAATLNWLGFDRVATVYALAAFTGVRRRFDNIGIAAGVLVVDDYGHHPSEVSATLAAASRLGFPHIHVLFQPHRYTRTQAFMDEFAQSFDSASTVTLMEIYSAGEASIDGITSEVLLEKIARHNDTLPLARISDREAIPQAMAALAQPGDLIITMGAGDITYLAPHVLTALQENAEKEAQGIFNDSI